VDFAPKIWCSSVAMPANQQ